MKVIGGMFDKFGVMAGKSLDILICGEWGDGSGVRVKEGKDSTDSLPPQGCQYFIGVSSGQQWLNDFSSPVIRIYAAFLYILYYLFSLPFLMTLKVGYKILLGVCCFVHL